VRVRRFLPCLDLQVRPEPFKRDMQAMFLKDPGFKSCLGRSEDA
jgi:hypothetical protein